MRDHSALPGLVFPLPYVPTLGPVHPALDTSRLWREILANHDTGGFLPYDPASRWAGTKDERVLVADVDSSPERVVVPTLRGRRSELLTAHAYGTLAIREAREEVTKLAADHGAQRARILWLTPHPPAQAGACRRIQMKTFHPEESAPDAERIGTLDAQPDDIRATWPAFAQAMEKEGFTSLLERMRAARLEAPILVAVADRRIVGAIGPMVTLPDPVGASRLLPQYLGVLPENRGQGLGRTLWRAAACWGASAGARYQIHQTEFGGASDRMFRSEGLATLGFATAITV